MTDTGRDYETARKVVAEFIVLHDCDGYPLLEAMLSDLGFEDLLCAVRAARELKRGYDTRKISSKQLEDKLRVAFRLSNAVAYRIMDDIRTGAVQAFAPLSGDVLDALSGAIDHENRNEDYYHSSLYTSWIREQGAVDKAINHYCPEPASHALARELATRPGMAVTCPDARPIDWFGDDGPPMILALGHGWDDAAADMAIYRSRGNGGVASQVFVFCRRREEAMRTIRAAGGIIVVFSPIAVEDDLGSCADEVLRRLPPTV